MKIDRVEVVKAIINRMDALHLRHAIVFDPRAAAVARVPFIPIAEQLTDGLEAGVESAVTIARALVDPADLESGPFWALDFGRLLFLAGGWRDETMSQSMAAFVLGFSRQRVHQLVKDGKLSSVQPDFRAPFVVFTDEVRAMLKAKVDRDVK